MKAIPNGILISDFDGTITRHDFYTLAGERLLQPADLQPWQDYVAGRITHFEALRRIFAAIRASEAELDEVLAAMEIDPGLAASMQRLREAGWEIVVVSNGCGWYIEKLMRQADVEVTVHTNPGRYHPSQGLIMDLPASPFLDPRTGISKAAVVRQALQRCPRVAFAGDGRPDLEPALLVPPHARFARGWLADELLRLGLPFQPFSTWSAIVPDLLRAAAK